MIKIDTNNLTMEQFYRGILFAPKNVGFIRIFNELYRIDYN